MDDDYNIIGPAYGYRLPTADADAPRSAASGGSRLSARAT